MKIFSRFPVFRLAVPFSLGILFAVQFECKISTQLILLALGFSVALLFTVKNYATGKYAQRWLAGIPFYCCFFALGSCLTWFHQSKHFVHHFQDSRNANASMLEILDEPKITSKGFRFIGAIRAIKTQKEWQYAAGQILVFIKDTAHNFKGVPGVKMLVYGTPEQFKKSTNPESFDPSRFYAAKGAWHQLFVAEGSYEIIDEHVKHGPFYYARTLRDLMLLKLKKYISEDELGVAGALLLGYEEWLDPELEQSWSGAGVLHVLCVSGMHVMLIYVILAAILSWMERNKILRHLRFLILLVMIWFYAMVTGFSPSVIRAASMISFVVVGNWINREASIYNLLCSSCILMFIIDPYLLVSAGFQLSFLAVCGIIFFHKLIFPLWIAPNTLLHKTWELMSVSIAAQLTTFPLSLYLFHQFPNYFLIANLLIIPLSTVIMYSGLLLLVTDWIPYMGNLFGYLTSIGIKLLNQLVLIIGSIPGAITQNVYLTEIETIGIYLLLILIPVWLVNKSRQWFFSLMVILSLLLMERILIVIPTNKQAQFTVYESHGHALISFLKARSASVFKDELLTEFNTRRIVSPHLMKCLIQNANTFTLTNDSFIVVRNVYPNDIIIIQGWPKNYVLPHALIKLNQPVLVMGGYLGCRPEQIIDGIRPSKVIFDSSCKRNQVSKLKVELTNSGIETHSVSEEGAFLIP